MNPTTDNSRRQDSRASTTDNSRAKALQFALIAIAIAFSIAGALTLATYA